MSQKPFQPSPGEIRAEIGKAGWMIVENDFRHFYATRGEQATPIRKTLEAVLEDCQRIGCHALPGELGPNGDRAKLSLKTEYSCNSVSSKGPVAQGAGAVLDFFNDSLQILVYEGEAGQEGDEPALHVRLNADGTIAEIVMRSRDLLRLCTFEGEPRAVSKWEKERDGV